MIPRKWIVTACIAGATLIGSTGVYAGANLQSISAYLNNGLSIQVNGSSYTPTANGQTLAPITYQGTTYLPVRSIADALQVGVKYDATANQVVINSTPTTSATNGATSTTSSSTSTSNVPITMTTQVFPTKYLPEDIPFPSDAHATSVTEDLAGDGEKQSFIIYTTQEDLVTLGNAYQNYFEAQGLNETNSIIDSDSLSIVGEVEGSYGISIQGNPLPNQPNYNQINFTWTEQPASVD